MVPNRLLFEMDVLRPRWGWLLFLGIVMATLGTIVLLIVPAATIGIALLAGWLLVLSGIIEMVHAFCVRLWGGLFLHLIGGVLGLLVGLLVVTHPLTGAVAWTLLFASFLSVVGAFRMIAAVSLKFPHWGWAVFDGIVSLGLGSLLWVEWPWSGLWFLGPVNWHFTGAPRAVVCDVRDRHTKLAGAGQHTPGSLAVGSSNQFSLLGGRQ